MDEWQKKQITAHKHTYSNPLVHINAFTDECQNICKVNVLAVHSAFYVVFFALYVDLLLCPIEFKCMVGIT